VHTERSLIENTITDAVLIQFDLPDYEHGVAQNVSRIIITNVSGLPRNSVRGGGGGVVQQIQLRTEKKGIWGR